MKTKVTIGIIILLILPFFFTLYSWYLKPLQEEVRREVFENTKSYREGHRKELIRYMTQFRLAKTREEKLIIASAVRHIFADVDLSGIDPEIYNFYQTCLQCTESYKVDKQGGL